jgi:hypothetical protein
MPRPLHGWPEFAYEIVIVVIHVPSDASFCHPLFVGA